MFKHRSTNIQVGELVDLYLVRKLSVSQIACLKNCSENKINYWLQKYTIPKRTISDAIYIKNNPAGDPFVVSYPKNLEEAIIYGLGLGLYWGEGNKKNTTSIRVGNTDPDLILTFINFLDKIYKINKTKLKYSLQIFSDMPPRKIINFWASKLKIKASQLGRPVVTPTRGIGNYKNKSKYGVLTVHFNNRKLRDIICGEIEKLRMPL